MVQGAVLLGLNNVTDQVLQPWGPRTLLRRPDEAVLRVTFVEHDFDVLFPAEIPFNEG